MTKAEQQRVRNVIARRLLTEVRLADGTVGWLVGWRTDRETGEVRALVRGGRVGKGWVAEVEAGNVCGSLAVGTSDGLVADP